MPRIGISTRPLPRMEILKGYFPEQATNLESFHPVKTGELIKSGMLISTEVNDGVVEWVKGWQAGNGTPHFSCSDYDDFSVEQAGVLKGISCSGSYRIITPYFKAVPAVAYKAGSALVPDSTTGYVKSAAAFAPAAGEAVIGYSGPNVSGGALDYSSQLSGVDAADVLEIDTNWAPQAS